MFNIVVPDFSDIAVVIGIGLCFFVPNLTLIIYTFKDTVLSFFIQFVASHVAQIIAFRVKEECV